MASRSKTWTPEKISQLEKVMKLNPTSLDAAHIMGVAQPNLDRFIQSHYKMTFSEFKDMHMATVKRKLVQIALEQALSGENNCMLIFCLKNLCGWTDKAQIDQKIDTTITLNYRVEDL